MQLDNAQPACFQLWQATIVEIKVQHVSRNSLFAGNRRPFKKKTRHATHCARVASDGSLHGLFSSTMLCQGWCHKLSCWPSSMDLSTSNHRPNPHHLKIALFECLKFVKQSDFAMFVVESMWWFKRSFMRHDRFFFEIYQVLCYIVSSKDHTTFCKFFRLDNFAKDGVSTYPADLPVRI